MGRVCQDVFEPKGPDVDLQEAGSLHLAEEATTNRGAFLLVKSRKTAALRRACADLPEDVRTQARRALFKLAVEAGSPITGSRPDIELLSRFDVAVR